MGALKRGRLIPAAEVGRARSLSTAPETARRRIVPREELEARAAHRALIDAAKVEAARILDEARAAAKDTFDRAAEEASAREQAKLAAAWIALRAREERRAELDLERAIGLATVLAERLVGAALEVHPDKALALAKGALAEARGARRATILAHPADAEALSARIDALGLPEGAVQVLADDAQERGSLAVQTELGMIDARLRPQLERLARALAEALVEAKG